MIKLAHYGPNGSNPNVHFISVTVDQEVFNTICKSMNVKSDMTFGFRTSTDKPDEIHLVPDPQGRSRFNTENKTNNLRLVWSVRPVDVEHMQLFGRTVIEQYRIERTGVMLKIPTTLQSLQRKNGGNKKPKVVNTSSSGHLISELRMAVSNLRHIAKALRKSGHEVNFKIDGNDIAIDLTYTKSIEI